MRYLFAGIRRSSMMLSGFFSILASMLSAASSGMDVIASTTMSICLVVSSLTSDRISLALSARLIFSVRLLIHHVSFKHLELLRDGLGDLVDVGLFTDDESIRELRDVYGLPG